MSIKLSVPLVTQEKSMECWYASACMIAYYWSAGPRLGLPEKWEANHGIQLNDFTRLAAAEGLKPVLTPSGALTPQQLETFLRNFGPLWCAGMWDGCGHIVVLTGVENDTVFINDPSPYKNAREEHLAWFNSRLDRAPSCLMHGKK